MQLVYYIRVCYLQKDSRKTKYISLFFPHHYISFVFVQWSAPKRIWLRAISFLNLNHLLCAAIRLNRTKPENHFANCGCTATIVLYNHNPCQKGKILLRPKKKKDIIKLLSEGKQTKKGKAMGRHKLRTKAEYRQYLEGLSDQELFGADYTKLRNEAMTEAVEELKEELAGESLEGITGSYWYQRYREEAIEERVKHWEGN